ncbi:MAG: mechanosensitive ion channel family protein [Deltaproteobacteria bacterium]|nr:mechanosensitive ion channel family protein [Deltaproteobacteria bacterium]MBW2360898.1 mechanosensitive ion channel family protein [Deltaproteobacteria bacterium]
MSHRLHLSSPSPLFLAAIATLALLAPAAVAVEEPAADVPAPAEPAEEIALDHTTPRGAMLAFLSASRDGDFQRAAACLDLSPLPQRKRAIEGPRLARRLKLVLDRMLWVDPELLSADPGGHRDDGLPSIRDRVGSIATADGPFEITVDRVRDASGERRWLVSARTVAKIPDLYAEHGWGPLGDWLPDTFFRSELLNIQLWQWLALLTLLVLAYALSWVVVRLGLVTLVRPFTARTDTDLDNRLLELTAGPLRLAVAVTFFALGVLSLGLAPPAARFFGSIEKIFFVVSVTWLLLRLVDVFGQLTEQRMLRRGQASALSLVPLGRKGLKLAVVVLAGLAALDSFGFDVTALIAGLGVGGLAVALAAQKTIENLFGGATLLADRPVQVGDFCRFGDRVGTVEEIGLRSTRVRTIDRTIVTVPNAEFSTLQLENFAARDRIWFHPQLGLRYETTPDQLRYVLVEIRRMLYAHPKVDPDPARVRFVGFGSSSLDLDIFAYLRTCDYAEYLEIAEDLNLRIMDIVAEAGTGFAFPSSTTYLAKDDGVDTERGAAAEQTVAKWRERGELFLPAFPPRQIQDLSDRLPWPPEGTPGASSEV